VNGPTLEEQATAALARIGRYPVALSVAPDRRALWLAAVAHLASAAADFAALAAAGDEDAFMAQGAIGDALLGACAAEAVHAVVEAQREIGPLNLRREWRDYGKALASGDSTGEEGQRLLVAIAERLEAKYGV
jgi:hypothetical protein